MVAVVVRRVVEVGVVVVSGCAVLPSASGMQLQAVGQPSRSYTNCTKVPGLQRQARMGTQSSSSRREVDVVKVVVISARVVVVVGARVVVVVGACVVVVGARVVVAVVAAVVDDVIGRAVGSVVASGGGRLVVVVSRGVLLRTVVLAVVTAAEVVTVLTAGSLLVVHLQTRQPLASVL